MTAPRSRRAWTDAEKRIVAWNWGAEAPEKTAERVGRSRQAVALHLVRDRGTSTLYAGERWSMEGLARELGVYWRTLGRAIVAARVKPIKTTSGPHRRYIFTPEQAEKVAIALEEVLKQDEERRSRRVARIAAAAGVHRSTASRMRRRLGLDVQDDGSLSPDDAVVLLDALRGCP